MCHDGLAHERSGESSDTCSFVPYSSSSRPCRWAKRCWDARRRCVMRALVPFRSVCHMVRRGQVRTPPVYCTFAVEVQLRRRICPWRENRKKSAITWDGRCMFVSWYDGACTEERDLFGTHNILGCVGFTLKAILPLAPCPMPLLPLTLTPHLPLDGRRGSSWKA